MVDYIPVIDIATFDQRKTELAEQFNRAAQEHGFFQVIGHSVSQELIKQVAQMSLEFFKLPKQEKDKVAVPFQGYPWGYNQLSSETLSERTSGPVDLKEAFGMGTPHLYNAGHTTQDLNATFSNMSNQWPEKPENFQQVFEEYYFEMEKLGSTLLKIAAISLNLPENYFADYFEHAMCCLRALFYPKLENEPKDGQFRASEHSDWGSLTILYVKDYASGLQIKDRRSQSWVPVHFQEGAFIVNLGDLMARWTNDRWQSTLHRVILPDAEHNTDRLSLAFFQNPNSDALVECLPGCHSDSNPVKYEGTTVKKYLEMKFNSMPDF